MGKSEDLTGLTKGRWYVDHKCDYKSKNGRTLWHCICSCDAHTERDLTTSQLNGLRPPSCGCLAREEAQKRNFKDITGAKSGFLTAEYFVGFKNHRAIWHCSCSNCNSDKGIDLPNDVITQQHIKSCGCLKHEHAENFNDLVGETSGYLVVTEYAYTKNDRAYWKCKCTCGCNKTVIVEAYNITHKLVKSCGSLRHLPIKRIDEVNNRYGHLVVLGFDHYKKNGGTSYWKCKCDCGNEKVIAASSLRNGDSNSCGNCKYSDTAHKGSQPELEIVDYITTLDSSIAIKRHNRSILNGKEIDIYLPDYKLGIEYNGSWCHASENNPYGNKDKYFHRDKFLLAKSKGVHLITIFDVDYEYNKERILNIIKQIILEKDNPLFEPMEEIVYTDNDYDSGEWLKSFGYNEIGQEEPISYYSGKYKVFRCGKTIWKLNKK